MHGHLHASSGTALYKFCLAGIGIMRLAEYLAIPSIQKGELVPLLTEFQAIEETPVYAVFHREQKLVPRIRAFVDHLVSAFEVPPWRQPPDLPNDR
ncbi:hypothetical protein PPGU16_81390 (plasmid) [Paraburkholderia largidicola]|uniref:LysR substrate-binding domain-containing protein n=1 Tax=Paraburkholderia largidicola TaxID=3014751 RepID=A0A7I8C207_9BURK|nr:hypothetical protein PPGU16_81390 [Paraburkholderia sp. PGU16]